MSRHDDLKSLGPKSRNQLRHILSTGGDDAAWKLGQLRGRLGKHQSAALERILRSTVLLKGTEHLLPFPKTPHFIDRLQPTNQRSLEGMLSAIDHAVGIHTRRLNQIALSLHEIDVMLTKGDSAKSIDLISALIERDGWSHAVLRRLVLIRESLPDANDVIEDLVGLAGLLSNAVAVTSLIHAYSVDQNFLTIKRSILNLVNRGAVNIYSRTIARLAVQPFAKDRDDLALYLAEVEKCSLIDVVILAKFNAHLFDLTRYQNLFALTSQLGESSLFDQLLNLYPASDRDSEYLFFKQSSANSGANWTLIPRQTGH